MNNYSSFTTWGKFLTQRPTFVFEVGSQRWQNGLVHIGRSECVAAASGFIANTSPSLTSAKIKPCKYPDPQMYWCFGSNEKSNSNLANQMLLFIQMYSDMVLAIK